jgi:probable HAF family extracellular repeat protein
MQILNKLIMVLLIAGVTPCNLSAQEVKRAHARYKLVDLGTLGGPQSYVSIPDISYARILNNRGVVTGWADTSAPDPFPDVCFDDDCFIAHAFSWQRGRMRDLGTLPGGGSSQGNWISSNGLIAGISQNGEVDPLVPGFPEFRAVLWRKAEITDLGTLEGGYESIATSVNNRGQVVGFATNTIPDADSMVGLGVQTRAFLWQDGSIQDLGTLGTGTDAVALIVNERGQIAGNSYTSSEPSAVCQQAEVGSLTTGAFLWDHGIMKDLGSLGGTCTFAFDLNNRGEVVGGSSLAGDQMQHPFLYDGRNLVDLGTFGGDLGTAIALNDAGEATGWATYPANQVAHAAFWRHGKIKDLGTLPGDSSSFGFTVNASGQVVGLSVPPGGDFDSAHAFLWENSGPMVALESLVGGGSSLRLTEPETINDRGEIAGNGFDVDGNQHAFLLVPCDANDSNCQHASADPEFRPAQAMAKPANNQGNAIRHARRHPLKPRYQVSAPSAFATPNVSGAAESGATKTSDSVPNLFDSLDADRIRFSTTSSCTLPGRPCSPSLTRCCGTLHCVFSGGSTRVGYACK